MRVTPTLAPSGQSRARADCGARAPNISRDQIERADRRDLADLADPRDGADSADHGGHGGRGDFAGRDFRKDGADRAEASAA